MSSVIVLVQAADEEPCRHSKTLKVVRGSARMVLSLPSRPKALAASAYCLFRRVPEAMPQPSSSRMEKETRRRGDTAHSRCDQADDMTMGPGRLLLRSLRCADGLHGCSPGLRSSASSGTRTRGAR